MNPNSKKLGNNYLTKLFKLKQVAKLFNSILLKLFPELVVKSKCDVTFYVFIIFNIYFQIYVNLIYFIIFSLIFI